MSCLSIFSASAFGIISFVIKAEKEICASAKAAIVDPAACSGLLKSSSSGIEQLPCRRAAALHSPMYWLILCPQLPFAYARISAPNFAPALVIRVRDAGDDAGCGRDFLATLSGDVPISPEFRPRELVGLIWGAIRAAWRP